MQIPSTSTKFISAHMAGLGTLNLAKQKETPIKLAIMFIVSMSTTCGIHFCAQSTCSHSLHQQFDVSPVDLIKSCRGTRFKTAINVDTA